MPCLGGPEILKGITLRDKKAPRPYSSLKYRSDTPVFETLIISYNTYILDSIHRQCRLKRLSDDKSRVRKRVRRSLIIGYDRVRSTDWNCVDQNNKPADIKCDSLAVVELSSDLINIYFKFTSRKKFHVMRQA